MNPAARTIREILERRPSVPHARKEQRKAPSKQSTFTVTVHAPTVISRLRLLGKRILGQSAPKNPKALINRLLLATHPDRGGKADDFSKVLQISRELKKVYAIRSR